MHSLIFRDNRSRKFCASSQAPTWEPNTYKLRLVLLESGSVQTRLPKLELGNEPKFRKITHSFPTVSTVMTWMQTFEAKKIPIPANYGPVLEREADRVDILHGFDLFPV